MDQSELLTRLDDLEDRLTERKLGGASSGAIKRSIVAFVNSIPPKRSAVLFIGVSDDGEILGVGNADSRQKKVRRLAENECYPAIWVETEVLPTEPRPVLAVIVPHCTQRPHFSGPAYVRRGSETVAATEELYHELITSHNEKCRYILERRDETWTVEAIEERLGDSGPLNEHGFKERAECRIVEVTPHFVRFLNIASGTNFTELLEFLSVSYDDEKHRPKLVVRYRL